MRLGWRDMWLQVVVETKNDKNSNKQSGHYGPTLHQHPKWMAARMAVHYVDTWLYVCSIAQSGSYRFHYPLQYLYFNVPTPLFQILNLSTHIQQVTTPLDLRIARTN